MAVSNLKHGLWGTDVYKIWSSIKQRCLNPKNTRWSAYGGRGVSICQEWIEDPVAFAEHMGPRPSPDHTVDRIDNDGHYEPGNVRWATRSEQQLKTRRNKPVMINGELLTRREIAQRTGLSSAMVLSRINSGATEREIMAPKHQGRSLTRKVEPSNKLRFMVGGREYSTEEIAAATGLKPNTIRYRASRGYTGERLLLPRQKSQKS